MSFDGSSLLARQEVSLEDPMASGFSVNGGALPSPQAPQGPSLSLGPSHAQSLPQPRPAVLVDAGQVAGIWGQSDALSALQAWRRRRWRHVLTVALLLMAAPDLTLTTTCFD